MPVDVPSENVAASGGGATPHSSVPAIPRDVVDVVTLSALENIAYHIRTRTFEMIAGTSGGHLGGNSSTVELLTALYFGGFLRLNLGDPRDALRDRVLIRGHCGPARAAIFALLGWISEQELLSYRKLGSHLQGHEDMKLLRGVDITPSGSLGMLLSYGVGCALAARDRKDEFKAVVFLGDGEEQEGNVAEAARHAGHLALGNLACIIDRNRKQLSGRTKDTDASTDLALLWQSYGWHVVQVGNGHDIAEICRAYQFIGSKREPVVIIATTIKGYGLPDAETHFCGYHTIASCPRDALTAAIAERKAVPVVASVGQVLPAVRGRFTESSSQTFENTPLEIDISVDQANAEKLNVSQRHYFQELARLALFSKPAGPRFYCMTADFIPRPLIEQSGLHQLGSVVDVGLREQHLIAAAYGISVTYPNTRIFINLADAFLYRALDQVHAAVQGGGRMVIVLESAGISMAENGATHQSTGQPGALYCMPGVFLLEPADVYDLYKCLNWAFSENPGVVCIRTHRVPTGPLDVPASARSLTSYVAFDTADRPEVIIIASGCVTRTAVDAAKRALAEHSMPTRVVNVVNMKTLSERFVSFLDDDVPVLIVYNGSARVLESAVGASVLRYPVRRPSVALSHGFEVGTTGGVLQLLNHLELDAEGILRRLLTLRSSG